MAITAPQISAPESGNSTPVFVSVVLAVRNEQAHIAACLDAVLRQDYSHARMEVLVSDGMSSDRTREVIARVASGRNVSVRVLDNPEHIVSPGLNRAINQARGNIIVRVDGHTIIASDYVRQCVNALERTNADAVGGRMDAVGETPFGSAVALATSSAFGVGGARFHYSEKEEQVDTAYLGAWRRSVFEKVGLFDEEQVRNQDDEFNYRLRAQGGSIMLVPSIKSIYYSRATPQSLWRQYRQYGEWKVRVMQKHPREMQFRQFVPPLFVLSLAVLSVMSTFSRVGLVALAALLCAYLAANVSASIMACRRSKWWRFLPLLCGAFGVLHLAYGSGFLWGLLRFWSRWGVPHRFSRLAGAEESGLLFSGDSGPSRVGKSARNPAQVSSYKTLDDDQ
jgi:succinoglycan biosynthesis protein ExoA